MSSAEEEFQLSESMESVVVMTLGPNQPQTKIQLPAITWKLTNACWFVKIDISDYLGCETCSMCRTAQNKPTIICCCPLGNNPIHQEPFLVDAIFVVLWVIYRYSSLQKRPVSIV